MFALLLLSSLGFLLQHRSCLSRHLPHAQPCVCVRVCVLLCVCNCVHPSMCAHKGRRLSLIAQAHLLILGNRLASYRQKQCRRKKEKNTQAQTNAHKHKYAPQVPHSKPSTWTPNNLHPLAGSCVDGIDWYGLQYGLHCFRTKASPHKAKVML